MPPIPDRCRRSGSESTRKADVGNGTSNGVAREQDSPLDESRGKDPHRERLAINVADLLSLNPTVRSMLLDGKLDPDRDHVAVVDKTRGDEIAVLLVCPLLEAALACDVLRSGNRRRREPITRVYLQKRPGGSWVKLPRDAVLTGVDQDGTCHLSPDLFEDREVVEAVPLTPRSVFDRRRA